MLLFVFGFVGGAVVINSAVLVSLSVLLLVHYSVSTGGLPALPSLPSLPRPSRYCVSVCVCVSVLVFYFLLNIHCNPCLCSSSQVVSMQAQCCCHVGAVI